MAQQKLSVLMVCMGNICRSPTAEGVLRHLVRQAGGQKASERPFHEPPERLGRPLLVPRLAEDARARDPGPVVEPRHHVREEQLRHLVERLCPTRQSPPPVQALPELLQRPHQRHPQSAVPRPCTERPHHCRGRFPIDHPVKSQP